MFLCRPLGIFSLSALRWGGLRTGEGAGVFRRRLRLELDHGRARVWRVKPRCSGVGQVGSRLDLMAGAS